MVENENYKSYTANNGTELRFPKESVIQMTAEQRDYYQKMKDLYALPMPMDEVEKTDAIANALMNGGDLSGLL